MVKSISIDSDDPVLIPINNAATTDTTYQLIVKAIRDGLDWKDLPIDHPGRTFKGVWSRLSIHEPLILLDSHRITVPQLQRVQILELLHSSHCGITATRRQDNQLYYMAWPDT